MARADRRRGRTGSRRRGTGGQQGATTQAEQAAPQAARVTHTQPPRPHSRRRSPFSFLKRLQPRFVGEVLSELRKVTWPTVSETRYLTFVVAVVALAVGAMLGLVDLFFGWLIEQLFFS